MYPQSSCAEPDVYMIPTTLWYTWIQHSSLWYHLPMPMGGSAWSAPKPGEPLKKYPPAKREDNVDKILEPVYGFYVDNTWRDYDYGIDNLAFSGGGLRGFAYTGALKVSYRPLASVYQVVAIQRALDISRSLCFTRLHNGDTIARPRGRGMVCPLWVQSLNRVLHLLGPT